MRLHYTPALVLLLSSLSVATADVIGGGVFYDVGKQSYSNDTESPYPDGLSSDSGLCWAVTGSNMVQYWQDTHTVTNGTPNGYVDGYKDSTINPFGTRYLEVYETALSNLTSPNGGDVSNFLDWWYVGTDSDNRFTEDGDGDVDGDGDEDGGYYKTIYPDNTTASQSEGADSWSVAEEGNATNVANFIKTHAGVNGGSVGLGLGGRANHAITCWGYETDADDNITALILTDSDDEYFGAFRMEVELQKNVVQEMYLEDENGVYQHLGSIPKGEKLVLSSDDELDYYGNGLNFIDTVTAITVETPQATSSAETTLPVGNTTIAVNTKLAENTEHTGSGITVGYGNEVVILTSEKNVSLSLTAGGDTPGTGLTVARGGMASLEGLNISGYTDGGMVLDGNAYLHGGDVYIMGNETTGANKAGGVTNHTYLEIKDGGNIAFFANKGTQGGAIHNAAGATVSIRGNETVSFQANAATEGNDIYNDVGGVVNIADNKLVQFTGYDDNTAAIVNKGELYLAAPEDGSIKFNNSSLDSSEGTVYIGRDSNGRSTQSTGEVQFIKTETGETTTLAASTVKDITRINEGGQYVVYTYPSVQEKDIVSAQLTNVDVSYDTIKGTSMADAAMSVVDIQTSAALTISDVTMDTSSSVTALTESVLTLDNVQITLTDANLIAATGDSPYTFDLTDMFTGNYKITSLYFDLSGVSTDLTGSDIVFDLGDAYVANQDKAKFYTVDENGTPQLEWASIQSSATAFAIPEPTSATLSLLALAGLAARRRRK